MKLIRLDEDKIQLSGQGNTKVIKMRSGNPETDDFDELVTIMDQMFDMLLSNKYRNMFKIGSDMTSLRDVKRRFDKTISEIRKEQSEG